MDITNLESVLEAERNLSLVRNNYGADFFLKNGAEEGGQILREKWVLLKFLYLHKIFKKKLLISKKTFLEKTIYQIFLFTTVRKY